MGKPANALRRLREARGWTQEQLAALTKISQPTLSRLEHGVALPTTGMAEALAKALAVPVASIFPRGVRSEAA